MFDGERDDSASAWRALPPGLYFDNHDSMRFFILHMTNSQSDQAKHVSQIRMSSTTGTLQKRFAGYGGEFSSWADV